MRHFVKASLATAVVGAAMVAVGTASAGITNTKHYLGAGGPGPNTAAAGDTGEICIFCHTPHGGDTGAAVPLWNKRLSTATYQTYDQLGTSTLDAGITAIGSITLACLTCHDGTQAIDNILNDSGSGGYVADGGGASGKPYTWTSTDGSLNAAGQFVGSVDDGGTNIFEIGTDLRNDHPVSVQYGGGGVSQTSTAGPTRDTDFTVPDHQTVGTRHVWWIDNTTMEGSGSTANVLDKWDFKLYTRVDTSGAPFSGNQEPFVECGSCHDPHLETDTFLRITPAANSGASNFGSAVCLTCHAK